MTIYLEGKNCQAVWKKMGRGGREVTKDWEGGDNLFSRIQKLKIKFIKIEGGGQFATAQCIAQKQKINEYKFKSNNQFKFFDYSYSMSETYYVSNI